MAELRRPTRREAVARFDDPERLERAVSQLQSYGFDRADICLIARESGTSGRLAWEYGDRRQAADDPAVPHAATLTTADLQQGCALANGMAVVIAAFAAAGFTVATGDGSAAGWTAGESQRQFLDEQLGRGGVLVWVRTCDRAAEEQALEILRRRGGVEPHIREIPAAA